MQFVRTIIWIAVAVIVALFAIRNGAPVTVNLWSDLQMVTPLWVIVVLSFLTGLLPLLAMHRAARWRWRRRLEQSERALADARAAASPSDRKRCVSGMRGSDSVVYGGSRIIKK